MGLPKKAPLLVESETDELDIISKESGVCGAFGARALIVFCIRPSMVQSPLLLDAASTVLPTARRSVRVSAAPRFCTRTSRAVRWAEPAKRRPTLDGCAVSAIRTGASQNQLERNRYRVGVSNRQGECCHQPARRSGEL